MFGVKVTKKGNTEPTHIMVLNDKDIQQLTKEDAVIQGQMDSKPFAIVYNQSNEEEFTKNLKEMAGV